MRLITVSSGLQAMTHQLKSKHFAFLNWVCKYPCTFVDVKTILMNMNNHSVLKKITRYLHSTHVSYFSDTKIKLETKIVNSRYFKKAQKTYTRDFERKYISFKFRIKIPVSA